MTTFLFTLSLFGLAMVAMAIGVIVSNRELHGSCGGVGSDDCLCSLEKRRACALEEKARRLDPGAAADPVFFDRALLKGKGKGRGPEHDHTH